MGYVYRFLNRCGDVLYIGSTQNITVRMCVHFSRGVDIESDRRLPEEARKEVDSVEYIETKTMMDALVLEAYLISAIKPPYNKEYVDFGKLTYCVDFGVLEWIESSYRPNDKPTQNIVIYRNNELLYKIPMERSVYEPLFKELGIDLDMGEIRYCMPEYSNGYKVIRIAGKRRVLTGKQVMVPKYEYMGYGKRDNDS